MEGQEKLRAMLEKSRQVKEAKQEAAATQAYLDNPVPVPNMVAKQQMTEREWTNLCIIRQTSAKCAVEFFSGKDVSVDEVLKFAEKIEVWVCRRENR
jgi:hypothetical protein